MFGYLFLELILPILRIALQGNQNYADSRRKDVSLFRFFARTLTLQFNFPKTKFLLSEAERLGFVQKFQKSYRLFTFFLTSHCERQDVAFFAFWWLFLRPIRRCLRNGQIVIWFLLGCSFVLFQQMDARVPNMVLEKQFFYCKIYLQLVWNFNY